MTLTSMASDVAVVFVWTALTVGITLLVAWIYAPIAEAKRLAQEVDPAQEAAYIDPNDDNKRYVLSSCPLHVVRRSKKVLFTHPCLVRPIVCCCCAYFVEYHLGRWGMKRPTCR